MVCNPTVSAVSVPEIIAQVAHTGFYLVNVNSLLLFLNSKEMFHRMVNEHQLPLHLPHSMNQMQELEPSSLVGESQQKRRDETHIINISEQAGRKEVEVSPSSTFMLGDGSDV